MSAMKSNKTNLQSKLVKVFFIQVLLISLLTVAGVFTAQFLVQNVLMRAALEGEANHYWQLREKNEVVALPNTLNLLAYLAPDQDMSSVPVNLRRLTPGLQRATFEDKKPIVYVEDKGKDRLYLIFDEVNVAKLSFLFGVLPLVCVLIVLYLLAWMAYRQSHNAVSPLVMLAKAVENVDFSERDWIDVELDRLRDNPGIEVAVLVNAMDRFSDKLSNYIERERNFTRDVSHELRTPIAVLRGALELIERKYNSDGSDDMLQRMYRTLVDMEALIETLLLLARNQDSDMKKSALIVNDLLEQEVDMMRNIHQDKPISIEIEEAGILELDGPERVLRILIGNLLRNACNYTPQGVITVKIRTNGISIADSGVGIDQQKLSEVFKPYSRGDQTQQSSGYGLGLTIVKRLCNRFGWKLTIASKMGEGTEVFLLLPDAKLRIG